MQGSGAQKTASQSGDVYRLKGQPPAAFGAAAAGKKVSEMDKMLQEIKQKDAEHRSSREQAQTTQKPKKRRAIDEFLEEMKERGPAPVSMENAAMTKGSFDNGDPETTNLYVGNLAPTVTEELEGQPMIVGWGKAVKIQPRARAPGRLLPSAVTPPPMAVAPTIPSADANVSGKQTITVEIPLDECMKRRINHLARYVASDGLQFENAIRMREANNKADYGFLFEPQSPLGLYYRWRVYSFAMGDDEHSWREKPFQMTAEGPVWMPPKMPYESEKRGSASRSSGRHSYHNRTPAQENPVDDRVEDVIAPVVAPTALWIAEMSGEVVGEGGIVEAVAEAEVVEAGHGHLTIRARGSVVAALVHVPVAKTGNIEAIRMKEAAIKEDLKVEVVAIRTAQARMKSF
ncbi:unnamed protein product [Phytophthora lilii]|uniref:Unnamed protein product n=1 Tax=Phytophthora lilii TaxID=2077276 RepID=A0A9W6U3L9_9STRA|nr:unnamed protein product [Phytophthora lilii]